MNLITITFQRLFNLKMFRTYTWMDRFKYVLTCIHSQAILVSKLLRQIAKAWKADIGYRKSMVNKSFPTFPNWRMILSCSGPAGPFSGEATNWKFFTEATVTLPWKFKHQHWSCSCHLGDLFLSTSTPSFWLAKGPDKPLSVRFDFERKNESEWMESGLLIENSVCVGAAPPGSIAEAGMASMIHCILLGPLFINSYAVSTWFR